MNSDCPFKQMTQRMLEVGRKTFQVPRADGSLPRQFHEKAHACLRGQFHVQPAAESASQPGLFAQPRSYPAFIRFSSSMFAEDHFPDARGMAIKLHGVEGEVCDGAPSGQQDFVLINQPLAPFRNLHDASEMFEAVAQAGKLNPRKMLLPGYVFPSWNPWRARWFYLRLGMATAWTDLFKKNLACHSYFSVTPYRFGEGSTKYECHPDERSARIGKVPGKTFRQRLEASLAQGPLGFDFFLQIRSDDAEPLDDASKPWKGPLLRVAHLEIPCQKIDESFDLADTLAFNPWNCLKAHTPLGSLNEARALAYRDSALNRHASESFPLDRY